MERKILVIDATIQTKYFITIVHQCINTDFYVAFGLLNNSAVLGVHVPSMDVCHRSVHYKFLLSIDILLLWMIFL